MSELTVIKSATGTLMAADQLDKLLRYDMDTGKLFWRRRPAGMFKTIRACKAWNTRYAGKEAGALCPNGYIRFRLVRRPIYAHRAAYAMYHGRWPDGQIDHWNGVLTDNRPSNLRDVTHTGNGRNAKMKKNNTSGFNGVSWFARDRKWQVGINVGGKRRYLGAFDDIEDAVAARKEADKKHGYSERHGL